MTVCAVLVLCVESRLHAGQCVEQPVGFPALPRQEPFPLQLHRQPSSQHSTQYKRGHLLFLFFLFRSHCKFLCRYVMSLLIIMIFFFYYYIFFFLFYWFLFWFILSEFNLVLLCNVLVQAPGIHFSKKCSRYLIVMRKEVEMMRSRICYSELLLNNYQTCLVTFQILVFQSIS